MHHPKEVRYRVRHGGYVSEFTQFLEGYLGTHPAVEPDQQQGWYKLWEKHVDLGELDKERKDSLPFRPYD
jgi:hypothetical protein